MVETESDKARRRQDLGGPFSVWPLWEVRSECLLKIGMKIFDLFTDITNIKISSFY